MNPFGVLIGEQFHKPRNEMGGRFYRPVGIGSLSGPGGRWGYGTGSNDFWSVPVLSGRIFPKFRPLVYELLRMFLV